MFDDLFSSYSQAISKGRASTLAFLLEHKRDIISQVGFFGFKQFTLNYRIYFDHRNVNRILHDYRKYVLSKGVHHKSDLAISHNLIRKIPISKELEIEAVEFMFNRMKDTYLSEHKRFANNPKAFILKKQLALTYVNDHILKKIDRNQ